MHPGAPGSDTIISAGTPDVDSGQLALVDGHLWVGTWYGVVDLDLAGTATYTPDSPAPLLTTTNGTPQSFLATTDADYLLLPWDSSFADADGNAAPGILKVVSPDAPAPTATLDGTTATVAWDASANGGSEITSATVTATDTTTGTTLAPVRSDFSGFDDNAYLDTDSETATVDVTGLTTGHTYTFSVTQGNGFKSSQEGTSAPVTVALAATAKPSRITVVGTPRVGTRLTTRATGSWASGATLTYAWYAGTTKVGTASSYTPTTATAGKRIKVAVTGTAAGHAPSTVTSAATAPVSLPVYKVSHKPTITGKAKVGRILTAHITGLPRHAVVKYQWGYSGGQYGGGIGHRTTKRTLKVPASVRHTRIEVIVYVTVPGYSTGSAMSRLTAVVK